LKKTFSRAFAATRRSQTITSAQFAPALRIAVGAAKAGTRSPKVRRDAIEEYIE